MVVAARVGRELLGSVWVITPTELRGPALAALRDGARTVALHLLRSRASADLERQVESEAVLRLLDGAADAVTVASRLGLAGGPLRVIALRARLQSEPHTALLVVFERATSGFGWSRPGRTALAGNTVYTVLPCDDADAARRWVGALRDGLPRGGGNAPAQAAVAFQPSFFAGPSPIEEAVRRLDPDGMTPIESIRAATVNAADLLGLSNEIGTIAAGKSADIIAVTGDPVADVRLLKKVDFVMARGSVID